MAKMKFPETLKAALENEASQWVLGDALKKECPPGSSLDKIGEAQKFLAENGIEYSEATLRKLRDVSKVFPADKLDADGNVVKRGNRFPQQSWTVHLKFQGYPGKLREWVDGHEGEKLTVAEANKRIKELVDADKAIEQQKNAKLAAELVKKSENDGKKVDEQETTTTNQPVTPQPETITTKPEEVETQANSNGADTPAAAPVEAEPVTKETWEAQSAVRFSAAVKTMLAELEIINNHAKSGNFGNAWHTSTTNDLEMLDAAMTKTAELLDTVDDEKDAQDPVIGADNVVPLQSATAH